MNAMHAFLDQVLSRFIREDIRERNLIFVRILAVRKSSQRAAISKLI